MVDFHTHLLPGFDDGAEEAATAKIMLGALKAAGFNEVVLSSHFYSNERTAEDFVKCRKNAFDVLNAVLEGVDTPKLYLGAEVYLTSLIFNNPDLLPLTVNGNGVMLTELPYDRKFSTVTEQNLERLIYNCGITPVLAHIERYPFLLDKGLLGELFAMGCSAQVNFSAFCGRHKRKLKSLANKGFLFSFGTDTHRVSDLENINAYLAAAEKTVGKEYLEYSFAYTKEKLL